MPPLATLITSLIALALLTRFCASSPCKDTARIGLPFIADITHGICARCGDSDAELACASCGLDTPTLE